MSKSKIKIAFVLNKFPCLSETYILNQIIYLIDQGHDLTIFSLYNGDHDNVHRRVYEYGLIDKLINIPPIPTSIIERVKIVCISLIDNFTISFLYDLLKCLNFFRFKMRALNFYIAYNYSQFKEINRNDIIHAHFGNNGDLMSKLKKAGLIRPKLVVSFHGNDISPNQISAYKIQYRDLFKYSDLVTVNSIYSEQIVKAITSRFSEKIQLLPVGLDTSIFSKRKRKIKSNINVLFCGRLIPLKGVSLAIEAFNKLVERGFSNVYFTIVGDGPEKNDLLKRIELLGLESKITLCGSKTQEELIQIYDDSDMFIFPSIKDPVTGRCETQGLVVQEAQAMELPVVVSDVGGVKYGLLNNVTGFVIKEGDLDAFVDALQTLIVHPRYRSEMGNKGKEFVRNNFDINILGMKLEKLYLHILSDLK